MVFEWYSLCTTQGSTNGRSPASEAVEIKVRILYPEPFIRKLSHEIYWQAGLQPTNTFVIK